MANGCTEIPYTNPDGTVNPFGGYCLETLAQDHRLINNIYPGWSTSGYATSTAPVPQAAKDAYTGVPQGGNGGLNFPTSQQTMANPVTNPLADVNNSFDVNNFLGGVAGAGCDSITNATVKALCKAAAGAFGTPKQPAGQACPQGYHKAADGSCVLDGMAPYIPGDIGRPDVIWTPINGRFGQGASPVRMQTTRLACPTGMVLGKDGVCYDHLARSNRKWNPGAKPLLTGGEMNAIRTAKRVQKRWAKVAPALHKKVVPAGAKMVKRKK